MQTTTTRLQPHRTTYGSIALIAIVWVVYATVRPDTTLHLGPLLLPLLPLVTENAGTNRVPFVVTGAVVAGAVLVLLSATGGLSGPAIEPFTTATAESAASLLVATLTGLGIAYLTR